MKIKRVYLSILFVILLMFPFSGYSTVHQVDMVGLDFVPDSLNIMHGDTVLWVNQTTINHTTTSGTGGVPDGLWDSGLMPANDSFAFAFDTVGVFPYYCIPHWQLGMVGRIVVSQTSIKESESFESKVITSLYNHPNPFKNSTKISYSIDLKDIQAVVSTVQLDIFDATGEHVRSFRESTGAQANEIIWDGRDHRGQILPEGIYFSRLTLGEVTKTYKMLKLR